MNWLSKLLSAVAAWFASVRTGQRPAPVHVSAPTPAATDAPVPTDDVPREAAPADPVPAAAPLVAEQGVLSGLEVAAPGTGVNGGGATAEPTVPKRKPRTKKKAAEPAVEGPTEAAAAPVEEPTLVDDPANPHGWTVKGNAKSGLYHAPASPWYGRTKAEVWFESEQAAEAAGFTRWDRRPKK